jgi:DNA primase
MNILDVIKPWVELTQGWMYSRMHWGLCPFHQEKTPSFWVKDEQFFCMGCGVSGDAAEFQRLIESREQRIDT